jgi:predicted PurR-regulated permease PerM
MALFLFRKLAEPKVVGNQTGLSPLASLISIYVGMKLGGVLGMILCPILCMIFVGLYGMGFFDPTISDFKQLLHWILHAAQLDTDESQEE